MKRLLIVFLFSAAVCAMEEPSLDSQLDQLRLPENQAPAVTSDRLYAVQDRFSPLRFRSELSGGGAFLVGDGYVSSVNIDLSYRFHLNGRWALGLSASYVVNNALTASGRRLLETVGRIPDTAYTKNRQDLSLCFNTFYGKFRLGLEKNYYFDQYLALGVGSVEQNTGRHTAAVGEAGLVFWLGRWGSLRLAAKDYYHFETRVVSRGWVHDILAHAEMGVLFGG